MNNQRLKKILIAEDTPDLLMILIDLLELEGYQVHTTDDGQGAWDYLNACNRLPDVVITDIMMPRLNGVDLLKKIRENEKFKELPVLVYSASPHYKRDVESLNACFISKPFDIDKLMNTIQETFVSKEKLCDGTQN